MPMEGLCPLEQVCSRQLSSKAPTRWTPVKLRHKRRWRPSAGATCPLHTRLSRPGDRSPRRRRLCPTPARKQPQRRRQHLALPRRQRPRPRSTRLRAQTRSRHSWQHLTRRGKYHERHAPQMKISKPCVRLQPGHLREQEHKSGVRPDGCPTPQSRLKFTRTSPMRTWGACCNTRFRTHRAVGIERLGV